MRRALALLAPLAVVALGAGRARAADPHPSWGLLPFGNGYGVGVWDVGAQRPNALFEHPYRFAEPGLETRDLLWDTYFGFRIGGGSGQWQTDVAADDVRLLDGSGIVAVTQTIGVLSVETYAFSPWAIEAPAIALLVRVVGSDRVPAQGIDVTAYGLQNLHMGDGRPDPGTVGEHIVWDPASGTFAETGAAGAAVLSPLTPPQRHTCSPNDPFGDGTAGRDYVDTGDSGVIDDAVAGFQWNLGLLRRGDSAWLGLVIATDAAGDVGALRAKIEQGVGGRDPRTMLANERAGWEAFLGPVPADLDDRNLAARVGLAVLRMAQVREPGRGHGQIVASLPPGQWNIAWVRDMAYAIVGLAQAGRTNEARAALDFMLDADAGTYENEVGEPYRISVTRYFGNGTEESDVNEDGPNIELDGWGLFLWAARHHVDAANDGGWIDDRWDDVRTGVADPLARRIDDTGLVQADSSIWEVHWNGRQKHFAYTSIAAARGLCDAAALAARVGDGDSEDRLRVRAREIGRAIAEALVAPDGTIGASLEDVQAAAGFRDAAVAEAIGWKVVTPRSGLGRATLDGLEELRIPGGLGYARNDDGGDYDRAEWAFVDLRLAVALETRGLVPAARDVVDWVAAQAGDNYGLIPELYDRESADYAGAVPMAGFGGAAFRLARELVEEDDSCFDAIVDPQPDGGVQDAGPDGGARQDEPAGCACRATPGVGGGGGAVLLALSCVGCAFRRMNRKTRRHEGSRQACKR